MTEQTLDNWIAQYEAAQKQNHAQFLRQFKAELYRHRQTELRQRRAALHNLNPAAPPPSMGTQSHSTRADRR
jgi:hypothetical protein